MLSRTLTGEWNGTVALSDYFISLESTTDLDLKTGICNVCVCVSVCVFVCVQLTDRNIRITMWILVSY